MKIDWKKEIKLPKLRRPSGLSSPKLSRRSVPKLGRPSFGGPELHAPKLLVDLYADLRDRRLLPLVALLIVAIVAAPILLPGNGDQEEAPGITPATAAGAEASDAKFTVVPAEPGLRNYKRRLHHRTALNPFRRPQEKNEAKAPEGSGSPVAANEASSAGGASEPTATITIGGVTREVSASTVETGPSETAPVETGPTEPTPAETPEPSTPESSPPEGPQPRSPESTPAETPPAAEPAHHEGSHGPGGNPSATQEVVGYTIDAEAGFVPHTTEKTEVAPMTKLPNAKHPVILFMGLSKDHKRALFLMTSNVTAYYGGHCALDKQACQLVEVKPGKGVTFAYGYGNSRYRLHLKRIVPIKHFSK